MTLEVEENEINAPFHLMKGDAGDKNNCSAKGSKKSHSPPQSKSSLCPISGAVVLIAFHFIMRSMAPPVSSPRPAWLPAKTDARIPSPDRGSSKRGQDEHFHKCLVARGVSSRTIDGKSCAWHAVGPAKWDNLGEEIAELAAKVPEAGRTLPNSPVADS